MNKSTYNNELNVAARRIGKIASAIALLMSASAFAQTPHFTPGNLVVSVSGCGVYGGTPPNTTPSSATCATAPAGGTGGTTGNGSNSYGDDQAAPWNLWQYSVNGATSVSFVNSLQLPQTVTGANYPVSNDYGSQSEGTLQLSGNGAYLTMLGIGISGATFNVNPVAYCPNSTILSNACVPENGNPAAAQTGSLTSNQNTPAVPRVAVLIDANGNVNSSTLLYNIFNQNDPRSMYTSDGVNLYVSGQGCKTWIVSTNTCVSSGGSYDDTSGVYLATLGTAYTTGTPTAITGPDNGPSGCTSTSTCTSSISTRTVQIASPTGSGTVNTTNSATGACTSNCVIWQSGSQFVPGVTSVTINSVSYAVSSVVTSALLKLSTAPGTQTGSAFSYTPPATMYVSLDDKPGSSTGGYNRSYLGTLSDTPGTPQTSLFTCAGIGAGCASGDGPYGPAVMTGFGNTGGTGKVTITSGANSNGNGLNAGLQINLSPSNYFYASPTVLYVADTGFPKNSSNGPDAVCTLNGATKTTTVGNGGLQKWIYSLAPFSGTLTSGSASLTGPSGTFSSADIGLTISGTGIPSTTSVTGTITSGSASVTATSGTFSSSNVGQPILGANIPAGTTIASVQSSTVATMSANAAGNETGETLTIGSVTTILSVQSSTSATMSANATHAESETITMGSGWNLAYTLSNGLNLVYNTDCNPSQVTTPGTANAVSGLYGLTGVVNGSTVTLYATSYATDDLIQTYLYGITDTLSSNSASQVSSESFTVLDSAPAGSLFRGVSFAPSIPTGYVEVTTVPSGLTVATSGTNCAPSSYSAPVSLNWTGATSCQLSVTSPQTVGGVQYTFAHWQDNSTGTTDTVSPSSGAAYTATFTPSEYQLTTTAGTGGTVSAGGYYASGTNATVTATPSSGYTFVNFTFPAGVVPSTNNPLTVPMNAAQSVTANFAAQGTQIAASAIYTGADTTTQGTWSGKYGSNGYSIANDSTNTIPSYATFGVTDAAQYTWSTASSPSALQVSNGSSSDIASAYYSNTFNINLNFTDGNTHQVSLYLLDYDSSSRGETISVLNASTNAVLSTQTFSGFQNGEYAIWNITGNVVIQVTQTAGANAVVSGVFFDPVPAGPSATYAGLDTTTQGNWTSKYGSNGFSIANDPNNNTIPSYATLGFTGNSQYTWSSPTTSPALQTYSGSSSYIASCYYSGTSFNINLNLTDGNTHQISLYLLDDDSTTRAETISILNASTNAILSTQSFSNFAGGQYAIWNITGNVIIQVTNTSGANAVVSGIFFDTVSTTTVSVPNVVGDLQAQAATVLTSAGLSPGVVTSASSSTIPAGNVITISPAAGTTVNSGSSVNMVVSSGPVITASATYANVDTTTQGNWTGKYGSNGFSIANDSANNTIAYFATLSFTGDSQYTWNSPTTSPALQTYSGSSSYIASCYYSSNSFNVNLNLTDGNTHKISLYLFDEDSTSRAETISIVNPSTNAVLSTQSFSNFAGGEYAIWNVTGNVIIQVTATSGANAVVSGIFID